MNYLKKLMLPRLLILVILSKKNLTYDKKFGETEQKILDIDIC